MPQSCIHQGLCTSISELLRRCFLCTLDPPLGSYVIPYKQKSARRMPVNATEVAAVHEYVRNFDGQTHIRMAILGARDVGKLSLVRRVGLPSHYDCLQIHDLYGLKHDSSIAIVSLATYLIHRRRKTLDYESRSQARQCVSTARCLRLLGQQSSGPWYTASDIHHFATSRPVSLCTTLATSQALTD